MHDLLKHNLIVQLPALPTNHTISLESRAPLPGPRWRLSSKYVFNPSCPSCYHFVEPLITVPGPEMSCSTDLVWSVWSSDAVQSRCAH